MRDGLVSKVLVDFRLLGRNQHFAIVEGVWRYLTFTKPEARLLHELSVLIPLIEFFFFLLAQLHEVNWVSLESDFSLSVETPECVTLLFSQPRLILDFVTGIIFLFQRFDNVPFQCLDVSGIFYFFHLLFDRVEVCMVLASKGRVSTTTRVLRVLWYVRSLRSFAWKFQCFLVIQHIVYGWATWRR